MSVDTPVARIDWHKLLRAGDQIVCSHMTSEPVALLRSLADAALDLDLGVTLGVPFSLAAADLPLRTTLTTFGGIGSAGAMAQHRRLRISLAPYGRCGDLFAQRIERSDVVLVSLARSPDGALTLGASHGYAIDAARRARTVIAEVNSSAPCVYGAPWPDDVPIHLTIETAYPPALPAERAPADVEMRLAAQVAQLIPDGACLQVGIGGMPSAVLSELKAHRHLGVHSGMLTDAMHRLIVSGVIDHSRKPAGHRRAVIGCVYGSPALYEFSHLNREVELREPRHTHNQALISTIPHFTAVNSAIEVDLTGQMNTEWFRTEDGRVRYVGGVGGINDFMRAAVLSPGGQAIVAIPSRTSSASKASSRIVARLSGPATVTAADADVVVTEHGVARLRDRPIEERVRGMLAIAEPLDRDRLTREARALGLIG